MPYERSGGKQCVVLGCSNSQKKLHEWGKSTCDEHNSLNRKDCPCLVPYKLHCIPKNEDRRRAWLKSINRKDFDPSSKSVVCSRHFIDRQPSKQNPIPVLHMGYTPATPQTPARRVLRRHPLKMKEIMSNIRTHDDLKPTSLTTETEIESDICHSTNFEDIYTATRLEYEGPCDRPQFVCCHLSPEICQVKKQEWLMPALKPRT